MWIKGLDNETQARVNMNHITHFKIKLSNGPTRIPYDVVAYLDAFNIGREPREGEEVEGQASVTVHRGTHEECEQFIEEKIRQQTISEWIGYLVAGSVGAVLAAVITVVLTLLFLQS